MGALHRRTATDLTRIRWVLFALRIGKLASSCSPEPAELGERGLENLLRSAEERRQIFHGTPRPGDLVLFKSRALRRLQREPH